MKGPPTQADAIQARASRLVRDHRARAKNAGVVLSYSVSDVRRLLAAHSVCEYCQLPLSFAVQLDHRTPIARGGRHQLDNLAVCCPRCNAIKGKLTAAEFSDLRGLLARLHPVARADLERRLQAGGARYGQSRRRV